jgi:hypothetical protein
MESAPPLRSTIGNIFGMYLANFFFGEFRSGNLNAKLDINSHIQNKEGWLKSITPFPPRSTGKMAIFHLLAVVESRGEAERRRCRQRGGGYAGGDFVSAMAKPGDSVATATAPPPHC